jgi:adenosylcobinamide-GDP ribazoletransferase
MGATKTPSEPGDEPGDEPDIEPGNWIDDLRVATAFLTRVPLRVGELSAPGRLAEASWAFPVVGIGVGIAGAAVYFAVHWMLGSPLAAVFAVGAQIALTGALHEDAAGDVADGLGGGGSREDKLAIMRDSRVGTYGVVALTLLVVARIAVISTLEESEYVLAALVVGGAVSRAAMVAVMDTLPAARSDGLGAAAGRPEQRNVAVAAAIGVVLSLLALGFGTGLAALAGGVAGAGFVAWLAWWQIGGHTGDVLGACQQGGEVICLAAIVAAMG